MSEKLLSQGELLDQLKQDYEQRKKVLESHYTRGISFDAAQREYRLIQELTGKLKAVEDVRVEGKKNAIRWLHKGWIREFQKDQYIKSARKWIMKHFDISEEEIQE